MVCWLCVVTDDAEADDAEGDAGLVVDASGRTAVTEDLEPSPPAQLFKLSHGVLVVAGLYRRCGSRGWHLTFQARFRKECPNGNC